MSTHDERLADLLVAWDDAEERGERPDLAAVCRDCPELAEPLADLLRVLGRVEDALEDTVPHAPAASRDRLPRLVGRYRLTRLIGRGGLGDVYGADDTELPREVAVKLIRAGIATEDARRRFAHEAAITSQLDHPGVVPVFGFHAPDGGTPYYAMRLIRGRSLSEEIIGFHEAEKAGRPAEETQRELRRLLASFVAACQTIAFAHSRGVLHRDIKPQNIMVGPYGETLVVDWGLAKQIAPDKEVPVSDMEATKLPAHVVGDTPSHTGTVGTLEYMGPEQVHGDASERSDIFGLGATLWKLLAGVSRLPPGTDSERLRLVSRGFYLAPEKTWSGTPLPLSAICAKAMAPEPADRYRTVSELIEDVEAWLADQTVNAYPDPWYVTARRWIVNHLPYVTAAGALLVAAFIAITVIAGLTKAHNDQIEADAKQLKANAIELKANAERLEAYAKRLEENYALAHQAMQEMMRVALTNPRLHASVHNPLRREMLERVIGYYRRALAHRAASATKPESPEERARSLPIRRELALATLFLGLTEFNLAMESDVPPAIRDGVEQYKALAAENPRDLDLVYGSIASRHLLGRAWYQLQKHDEAIRVLCEVHEELARLDPAAVPDVGEMTIVKTVGKPEVLRIELIVILADMTNTTPQMKQREQILGWVDAARTELEERDRAAGGKDVAIRIDLAKLQLQSGVTAMLTPDYPTAERRLKAAWASLTDPPREAGIEDFLLQLDVRLRLGMLYVQTKRPEQAVAELEPAYRELTPILDNFETQVAGNILPPRMAFEALAKLILVSAQLNAAEAMLGVVREPGSIAQGLEAMTRKKVRRQRLQVFSRALPLLVSQFPEAAIGLPLLASMANHAAEELSQLEMHAEAQSLLKAADTILAGNLARTPDALDLQVARIGLLVTLALAEEKLGHAAQEREANTTARRMLIAFLAKPEPLFEQPTHSVALLLGDDAMKTKQWREALDLFKVTCAAADRTIAQPSEPAFARQARNVLEITVYQCNSLLAVDPPLSAAELAEAKRQGLEALDILAKYGDTIDNAATYRERFSKG